MNDLSHRLCTAPMMDWTDRHCRYFLRLVSPHAFLYTEMVTTGALMFGNVPRHLDFDPDEHPVALQLGGSEPSALAHCARMGEAWGYDEINLNVGCPSERVQTGSFGACLMAEPALVADCVAAMRDAVSIPITVKHRIGINAIEEYGFVRDFVGRVAEAGTGTFIVHARNAILKGLSPKQNREVPPLKYDFVYRLKRELPQLEFILNGGLADVDGISASLPYVDGVMLGRVAYHDPYLLGSADAAHFRSASRRSRTDIVHAMMPYAQRELARGVPLRTITRHMLGLFHGLPGGRAWRRTLSDASLLRANDPRLLLRALDDVHAAANAMLSPA